MSYHEKLSHGDIDYDTSTGRLALVINPGCMKVETIVNPAEKTTFDVGERHRIHIVVVEIGTTIIRGTYQVSIGTNDSSHRILTDHGFFALAKVEKSDNSVLTVN